MPYWLNWLVNSKPIVKGSHLQGAAGTKDTEKDMSADEFEVQEYFEWLWGFDKIVNIGTIGLWIQN